MKRRTIGSILSSAWSTVGGWLGFGGYDVANPNRKILSLSDRPRNATANELLTASLPILRAYTRQLERNNPTARAAVEGHKAMIVGTGIALEPDTGDEGINAKIRAAWLEFIAECSVTGEDLYYLQSQACGEMVVAGEFLWRLVVLPERAALGKVPLAVLPLEAEWLDELATTVGAADKSGYVWVGGVGIDKYGRPQAYKIRHPEIASTEAETLGPNEIVHGFEKRRSLQARGEPWFAPVVETMQQERNLISSELKAAENTSSIAMVITSEFHDGLDTTEEGDSTDPAQTLRLGGVSRMFPGEKVDAFGHTRPAQQIAPFRKMLRGDEAGALRLPQRFLDRDVSGANYSSMRCDMLDSERIMSPIREWFGHLTAGRLYKAALPYLAIRAGVKMPRATYRLVPDGQPYVDPYKDVQAACMAIAAGLSNYEKETGKRGDSYRPIWKQAAIERKEAKTLDLKFDLSGTNAPAPDSTVNSDEQPPAKADAGDSELLPPNSAAKKGKR